MPARAQSELTLFDRLSHLTYAKACRLLGASAKQLLARGGAYEIDIDAQVRLSPDRLEVVLGPTSVSLELGPGALGLVSRCSQCEARSQGGPKSADGTRSRAASRNDRCEHIAAALSLVLEEKTVLGLAAPPPERVPVGSLSESEIAERALAERQERASREKMRVRSENPKQLYCDYRVTNSASGRTHRVALRGFGVGESYCSCPDFRKNTLGTCKHILRVEERVRRRFSAAQRRRPYRRNRYALYVAYGPSRTLHLAVPDKAATSEVARIVRPMTGRAIEDLPGLVRRLARLDRLDIDVHIHPDAEELLERGLQRVRLAELVEEIRKDPEGHGLRRDLLNVELLPYQLDGIAFAVGAGRAILADDMGLGKTIQGVGVAELLRRQVGIERVLVVCPATLKAQWRSEIERFSDHSVQIVLGSAKGRAQQYASGAFFTICNYEQVLRDRGAIERVAWDLIILDEAQRIKNWEARTSRLVKSLQSTFALALTGTPLENRLDDLYSVVEFIDEHRLGPAFRFFNRHRRTNERGAVLGYEDLGDLRQALSPVLLRRTRDLVMKELPARSTELVLVEPTEQQLDLHAGHMQMVLMITRKKYISEMDLLRLQKALLMCRMSADGTALVDKIRPGHSSKLDRLEELLAGLLEEEGRKVVVFSEWTTMLDLIEERLEKIVRRIADRGSGDATGSCSRGGPSWVRLDGKVAQKRRQMLVNRFQEDPQTRLFLTSNAGSTGLNLQAANTVVNVDLPWNPAVLEQRISRAHRMGQRRAVQVYLLVTEQTLEENLLATLSAKQDLALAVLDPDSDVEAVDMVSGVEELRERLEILLGAKPEIPAGPQERPVESRTGAKQRERIARAGGELVAAAFSFLGEVVPAGDSTPASREQSRRVRKQLEQCLTLDSEGRPTLTVRLPDRRSLDALAETLGRIMTLE